MPSIRSEIELWGTVAVILATFVIVALIKVFAASFRALLEWLNDHLRGHD